MQLDGFTVAAQIMNFLILVWLLKRFLYGPITQTIAARQQQIAAALEQAQHQMQQAEAEKQEYQARQTELEVQREAWLAQVQQEVAVQRESWLAAAQREVDTLRADGLIAWQREQTENQHLLQQEAVHRLTAAIRHALRAMADAELELQMIKPLLARLNTLAIDERAVLVQAAQGGCTITTTFPLDPALQAQWRTALGDWLGSEVPFRFHHDPNAACGITLNMPGHRLAWTLDGYLDDFCQQLNAVLNKKPAPAPVVVNDHAAC